MSDTPISRDDIEAKLREVKVGIDEKTDSAKSKLVPIAVGGGILLALLVFLLGRRVGSKKTALVEIRRI